MTFLPRPIRVVAVMVVGPLLALLAVPWGIVLATPEAWTAPPGPARFLALAPWALGTWLMLAAATAFVRVGRGLPTDVSPPPDLVTRGPSASVRNPMYLGALLVLIGHVLWSGSLALLAYTLLFAATLHAFVVHYEEPRLRARFGGGYRAYERRVPRWLPRLRGTDAARLHREPLSRR